MLFHQVNLYEILIEEFHDLFEHGSPCFSNTILQFSLAFDNLLYSEYRLSVNFQVLVLSLHKKIYLNY